MKRAIIAALMATMFSVAIAAPGNKEKLSKNKQKAALMATQEKQKNPKTLDRAEPDKHQGDSFLWDGAREGAALDRGRPSNPGFNNWDMWGKK